MAQAGFVRSELALAVQRETGVPRSPPAPGLGNEQHRCMQTCGQIREQVGATNGGRSRSAVIAVAVAKLIEGGADAGRGDGVDERRNASKPVLVVVSRLC